MFIFIWLGFLGDEPRPKYAEKNKLNSATGECTKETGTDGRPGVHIRSFCTGYMRDWERSHPLTRPAQGLVVLNLC
jgi:hypothetical protein